MTLFFPEGISVGGLPSQVASYILTYVEKLRNVRSLFSPRSEVREETIFESIFSRGVDMSQLAVKNQCTLFPLVYLLMATAWVLPS